MKILLDPVYTGLPSTCSTSYLMWELIDKLSAWREDVFFYLMYPRKHQFDAEQLKFLTRRPDRVVLIPKRYDPMDRVRELFTFDDELMEISAVCGSPYIDIDAVLTSRIQQLAMYRMTRREETAYQDGTFQAIIGLDEMPLLSFRDTVPWSYRGELHTLSNYLMSTGVVVNNLWTLESLKKSARDSLAPSKCRELLSKVREAVPVRLERLNIKTDLYKDGTQFNLAFTGRITGTRNFKQVVDLFRREFAYPVGKNKTLINFVVSTNSKSTGSSNYGDISFIDFQFNSREEFYKFLTEEAHVVVNLSTVEDFSLSTYETLKYGVPVIVPNQPWADFLGKDYPFRVKSLVEAYGCVKLFTDNYEEAYAKFAHWEATTWKALCDSDRNVTTSEQVIDILSKFQSGAFEYVSSRGLGGSYLKMADDVDKASPETVDLSRLIEINGGSCDLPLDKTPLMKRPSMSILKMLLSLRGYRDTIEPGIMKRSV